jgi:delta24-sterol reductase
MVAIVSAVATALAIALPRGAVPHGTLFRHVRLQPLHVSVKEPNAEAIAVREPPLQSMKPMLRKLSRKLATREDRFSAHKMLGCFAVLHAIFRLSQVGPADMGFGPTPVTLICIVLHAALSMSSFLFRIPLQRRGGQLSYGMWTEYRLQSIIFTLRSLAMMSLIWVEGAFGLAPLQGVNAVILLASMAASDASSRSVGAKGRSRTVRDLDASHATRLLFSVMQIQTSSALLLGQRRFSMHFIFVLVMQFNAFLMTLQRKKLVPFKAAVGIYGAMTVIGSATVFYETSVSQPGLFLVGNTLGNTAAALRIGLGAPKYPLWIVMAGLAHLARKTLPPPMGTQAGTQIFWPVLAAMSNIAILAVGWLSRPRSSLSEVESAASDIDVSRALGEAVAAADEIREVDHAADEPHAQRLAAAIQAGPVRSIYRRGSNRVPNGAPATARPDLSLLREVLSISSDHATITAEPGVTMEALVAAALPHGLMPKVVPEFRRITVGGAIMGGAMESGSFAHGMFHDTVASCELLLPNGTVVVASRTVHADILAALGGSYGSLATLTAATIECVRLPTRHLCPPRVALTFHWHADVADGVATLSAMAHARTFADGRRVDFLDGVALPTGSTAGGVLVCAGCAVDDEGAADDDGAPPEVWSVGAAGDAFYYEKLLDVGGRLAVGCGSADGTIRVSMELEDYLFRHDRGAFQIGSAALWLARWHDWITPTKLLLAAASARQPLNLRAVCDPLFAAGTMYERLHLAPPEAIASRLVLQDLFVPEARASAAVAFCQGHLTEPPCAIWLWPVRGTETPALLAPNGHVGSSEVLVNLGIYTRAPSSTPGGGVDFTRALERWGLANGCRKLLYSANYYEPDEFWAMYDRARYDALRVRTAATSVGQPGLDERVLSKLRAKRELPPQDAALVAVVEGLL